LTPPKPEQINEVYETHLPDACPDCSGPLDETHIAQQFQVEIPRKPTHRQFNIHVVGVADLLATGACGPGLP
jgi:hypothetical protein